jgi:hypothetical protein
LKKKKTLEKISVTRFRVEKNVIADENLARMGDTHIEQLRGRGQRVVQRLQKFFRGKYFHF